jgi:transcriptional regulator with XRE-family HTH domain
MEQTPAEQTAGAVRAELARRRVSGRDLARKLGWSPSATARRLSGEKPFDINELQQIASVLDVPVSLLVVVGQAA